MAEGWDLRKDCSVATPNAVFRSDFGHIQGPSTGPAITLGPAICKASKCFNPCAISLAALQHLKEEIIVVTGIMYLQESRICSPHPHHLMCMLVVP